MTHHMWGGLSVAAICWLCWMLRGRFGGQRLDVSVPVLRELGGAKAVTISSATRHESCMIVAATDAPLESRQLGRLAKRAVFCLARTGSAGENGSGDYVIAFSTSSRFPTEPSAAASASSTHGRLREDQLSPLFEATIEATEEAIDNSVLRATTIQGRDGHVAEAIPIDRLREAMKKYGR